MKLFMSMEVADNPVKKTKMKKTTCSRPKKCINHIVGSAKGETLSAFYGAVMVGNNLRVRHKAKDVDGQVEYALFM